MLKEEEKYTQIGQNRAVGAKGQGNRIQKKPLSSDSSDTQELCVYVKDLDSKDERSVDVKAMLELDQIKSVKGIGVWQQYWEQMKDMKQLLLRLVKQGNYEEFRNVFQEHPLDLGSYYYANGFNLLHYAVSRNDLIFSAMLLELGIDVNAQTQQMKSTALHLAVINNNQEICRLLLKNKADCNAQDMNYDTPSHYACDYGHTQIMELLLEEDNIDLTLQNNKKMTAYDCCRDHRLAEIIQECFQYHNQLVCQSKYNKRCQVLADGQKVLLKSRADYVNLLLNTKQNRMPTKIDAQKKWKSAGIGKRMCASKLDFLNFVASKSISSYQRSLSSNCAIETVLNYDFMRRVGSGSFGQVYLARKKKSSSLFAVKRIEKSIVNKNKLKKYVYTERQILKQLSHPFIIHASSFFQDANYLYIVMEYCEGGDLQRLVSRSHRLDEQLVRMYCCEVVLALEYIHKQNYLFRDLKPANVLMDEHGHLKLIDFGLAKHSEISYSFLGSVAYLAPEMLASTDNKMHCAAIDWYLLGVFCYQLLTGLPPFYSKNISQMHSNIKSSRPKIPGYVSPQCRSFLEQTLTKDPKKRLGFKNSEQIKSHAWFQGLDWQQVYERKLEVPKPHINEAQQRKRELVDIEYDETQLTGDHFACWDYNEGTSSIS